MAHVRRVARRWVFVAVVVAQVGFVARGYGADHKEFAWQMFPESSTWQAEVVRVLDDGTRAPVEQPWAGYRWDDLVRTRRLQYHQVRQHADGGVDNQLAFLRAALDYVATHTPRDDRTRYLEARVTYWHNARPAQVVTFRSRVRAVT